METISLKTITKHALVVAAALVLILGVPLFRSDAFAAMILGTDAVSGATTIIDAPGGEYLVLINRARHEAQGTLPVWETFFAGGDIGVVFEDLDCIVLRGDAGGFEAAKSYRSRLPENQMRVRTEDAVLAVSKAAYGKYDIVVMSAEAALAYGADVIAKAPHTSAVHVFSR